MKGKPYTFKPPLGSRPNLSHPLIRGAVAFFPFTEGAGVPRAYIEGALRAPDSNNLDSSAGWVQRPWGINYRPASTAGANSYLTWNNFPVLGTGEFTCLVSLRVENYQTGTTAILSGGSFSPIYVGSVTSGQAFATYFADSFDTATGCADGEDSVIWTGRDAASDLKREFSVNRVREGYATDNRTTNVIGNTLVLNASGGGSFGADDRFSYNWAAIWHRTLPDMQVALLLQQPEAIWQIYTRPVSVWFPAVAAGGTDVTGTLANLSITPLQATIGHDTTQAITGTLASLAITPLTATVNDKTQIAGTLASLAITPQTATVNDKTEVAGTLATLSISPQTATVNDKTQISGTLANLPLSPLTATVTQGNVQAITGTLATLSISPLTASVNDKTQVTGTLAALTITPLQAQVGGNTDVIGTLATLDLQVYVASVNDKTQIAGTLESLSITPLTAAINDKTQIAATLETLTIAAYQATVSAGISYPAPGTRTFTTKADGTFVTRAKDTYTTD